MAVCNHGDDYKCMNCREVFIRLPWQPKFQTDKQGRVWNMGSPRTYRINESTDEYSLVEDGKTPSTY